MFSDYYLVVSGFNHLPTTHLVTLNHFVTRKAPSSVNGFAYYNVLVATVKVPHDTSGVQFFNLPWDKIMVDVGLPVEMKPLPTISERIV